MGDTWDSRSSLATVESANIGLQLLKKQGWKEGTGLGIAKQGILVPVETLEKHNKLGLGAEKPKILRRKKSESSQATTSKNSEKMLDAMAESAGSISSWAAINASNIGFQLLKKQGWKEDTGLGIAEQGILEPVQTEPKITNEEWELKKNEEESGKSYRSWTQRRGGRSLKEIQETFKENAEDDGARKKFTGEGI